MSGQSSVPQPRTERTEQTGLAGPTERAGAMRAEFDSAFARSARPARTTLEDVLALRLGDERCVLRLRDLAGVIAHPLITGMPTAVPALLGMIGNRGSVVAAYDLCALRGGPATRPRWLVISAAEPSVGVTFEHFDGYRRITRGSAEGGRLIELAGVVEAIRALGPSSPGSLLSAPATQFNHPQLRSGD